MNVCVIGAGAAGLAAARRLSRKSNFFTFTVYEQGKSIGGQWNYEAKNKKQETEFHSSMYKNMKTNLPKEVMPFPGFPFTGCSESFLHHTQIQEYLVNFANHYSIEKHIKFDRKVIEVRPEVDQGHVKWIVKIMDVNSKQINTRKFDSVMVCIGNYSKPHVPEIPGINSFSGEIIHSHYYDDNTPYKDKTVVCLGRGPSGIDMSLEISKVAKKVNFVDFILSLLGISVAAYMGTIALIFPIKIGILTFLS